ncbi:unnamed protein product [Thlaspi arvense]|uniref:Uncharacterized protein n=1 Tax=Thlaspi arvense TaxID=13288 RepID=A0AAU9SME8_THLAR|nr:unnamed protein product [Thlaspi arvense]
MGRKKPWEANEARRRRREAEHGAKILRLPSTKIKLRGIEEQRKMMKGEVGEVRRRRKVNLTSTTDRVHKSKDDKHKKKHAEGDQQLKEGIPELSSEDYFSKNMEFATWLKEKKRTYFNDLTTEAARELFARFVKAWNRGKLEPRYYEGISTAPRTAHNWKIKHR